MPDRVFDDPIPSGPSKGSHLTREELRMMISDYYGARGWTSEGLIPRSKLIALGLEDVANDVGVDDEVLEPIAVKEEA